MAFWGKKEIPLEDFWVANVGEALQPGARELFENDIFYTLFPEARIQAEGNKHHYLEQASISVQQFLAYSRVAHLSSCCACAYLDDQKSFGRFGGLLVSQMADALKQDFASHGVPAAEALKLVHRAFLGQDTKHIDDWMHKGSETYGASSSLSDERAALLYQANVLYSFLVEYHRERVPSVAKAIQGNPSGSRDEAVQLIVTTKNLHDQIRRSYKPT